MIKISALRWVPQIARGLVRDLRVRWALEEAGLPYESQLIGPQDQASDAYRAMQPFGQVPVYDDDGLVLFESGAIVLHIAERSETLMPCNANARARTTAWMFAALNSVEPHIVNFTAADRDVNEDWAKQRRPALLKLAQARLTALSVWFRDREYLEERFTAADLLMTTVLRIPRHCDLLAQYPVLDAYRVRCEARPAFRRALDAQMADFVEKPAAVA